MPRLERRDWVLGAFRLTARSGIGGVKVEPLADALGVTKGSFYHHFADRTALLEAVLAHWVDQATDRIIALVEADPAPTPGRALHRLIEATITEPGEHDDAETAIREWAGDDPAVAEVVAEVDERRLGYVTALLVAAGVADDVAQHRAHLLYRVLIGEYLWRRYGGEPIDPDAVHDLADWMLET
ncbi:MAG: TetR/AcrR family transcriptional regulator [Actinomycetota bacterium]